MKPTKANTYFISRTGKLCIVFISSSDSPPELCEVIGCTNETWFLHKTIPTLK